MPPKSKRRIHLALARDAKRRKLENSTRHSSDPPISTSTDPSANLPGPVAADNSPTNSTEPSVSHYSACSSSSSSPVSDDMYTAHIEDWVSSLSRDDQMSLAITLHYSK